MKKQIGAAVVGLGGNGSGAVRAALSSEHVNKVIGVDLSEAARQRTNEKFEIETTDSLDQVLNDESINLIYISTNNSSHASIGIAALERGKSVCMEKPMGVDWDETTKLLNVVDSTNGFLDVSFELRTYSKLYARVKEILDSGEIGTLRHINLQYILSPFGNTTEAEKWKHNLELSGGLFQEKLCHYIDLPRWWDGTRVKQFFITKAENIIPYYTISDNFELTYQFESGVVSHLTFLTGAAGAGKGDLIKTNDIEVQKHEGYRLYYQLVGSEGALEANVFERELRVFYHPGKPEFGDFSRMVRVERWKQPEDHAYFHNSFDLKVDIARRVVEGKPPHMDPHDAAETMKLCYEFEEAATQPWKVVER